MAQFGIFVAFGDDKSAKIKGNSAVAGYEGWVLGHSVSYNTSAHRTDGPTGKLDGKVVANIGNLGLMLHGGSATAEMYKALFATQQFAKIHIHQCLQPADAASKQQPELIQKIDLTLAYITGVNELWLPGGERSVAIDLEFGHFMVTVGTKPADFTVRNITKAAD